ncbi:MAG: hypothetical protein QHJ81_14765 [Anaerolineae bacterium]|nr:hypothetical protein [Anaerolineae bacterium]
MSFRDFLRLLLTAEYIHAVIGFVMSFVVEWWPGFTELQPRVKRLVFMGLCFVIPLLSVVLQLAAGYAEFDFEGLVWPALVAGALAFLGGQVAHLRKL